MTATPCGQKNRSSEVIHNQMVTPALAAMEETTLRLKIATTKRSTRSRRPSTRLRWGGAGWVAVDKVLLRRVSLRFGGQPLRLRSGQAEAAVSTCVPALYARRAGAPAPHSQVLVRGQGQDLAGSVLLRLW